MRLLRTPLPLAVRAQSPTRQRPTRSAPDPSPAPANERRARRRGGLNVTFCLRLDAILDRPSRAEIDLVGSIIASRLRQEDGFDLRDDGAFTIVLAKTDLESARAVASRLASEVNYRSIVIRRRNWVAEFPD